MATKQTKKIDITPAVLTADQQKEAEIRKQIDKDLMVTEVVTSSSLVKVNKEVGKVNVTELILAKLEEKAKPLLAITGIPSKEEYDQIEEVRKLAKKIKTTGVAITKKGREDLKRESDMWIAEEKKFKNRIEGNVEDPLEILKDKYEVERNRIANEQANAQRERFGQRSIELSNLGAVYQDDKFVIGDISLDGSIVMEADDSVYQAALAPIKEESEKVAKDMEANLRQTRASMLKAVGIEEAEDLGKMDAAAFNTLYTNAKKKFDEEKDQREAAILNSRIDALREIGFTVDGNLILFGRNRDVQINKSTLLGDDVTFKQTYHNLTTRSEEVTKKYEKLDLHVTRAKMLDLLNVKYDNIDLGGMSEKEFTDRYNKAVEARNRIIAKKKEDDLKKQSDAVQWKAFVNQVKAIKVPKFTSDHYKKLAKEAEEFLDKAISVQAV